MTKRRNKPDPGPKGSTPPLALDSPELQRARQRWSRNQYEPALKLFRQAVRRQPDNTLALTDAARAFGARFEIPTAEKLLARLMKLVGNNADLLFQTGQSYRMIRRPEEAIACFESALANRSSLAEAHLELSILFERCHRLEESLEHAEAFLKSRPDSPEGKLVQARALRRSGDPARATTILESIVQATSAHPFIRSEAASLVAAILDQEGHYDEAFKMMEQSKGFLAPLAEPYQQRAVQELEFTTALREEMTEDVFAQWTSRADESKIALLTGVPRSGTTLLERILDAHPDILCSDEREAFPSYILPAVLSKSSNRPPALGRETLEKITDRSLNAQRERYRDYLSWTLGEEQGKRWLIDKNPSTVPLLPGFLRTVPSGKIIYASRDPRDVVLSCFFRYLPLNSVSVRFLDIRTAAERTRFELETWHHYRDLLPNNWVEVAYHDLVCDFQGALAPVLNILGLAWNDALNTYRDHNLNKSVNSPTYAEVTQPIHRAALGRWKNYESQLAPALEVLEGLGN
jgi:tetratricopeptide (TPR) repeat protein